MTAMALHHCAMTTARAVILSAVLIAVTMALVAWWTVTNQPQPERYQLVNVGKGETQRLDKVTGTVLRCSYGRCEPLTDRAKAIDRPDDWEAAGTTSTQDYPPPPPGSEIDNP